MADATAYAYAGVEAIGAAFRAGTLSPRAFAEAALARLDRLEPRLNAVIDPMRDVALAMAAKAEDELRAGRDRGPLHGMPIAIKDIIDIEGVSTSYATRAVDPTLPERDAGLVTRLREAGAVFLGKTNLLEFAYGIAHPAIGQTNNPFDTGRTSGGSSGGSAALVSAGIVPLAVGTDTGGSIRIPPLIAALSASSRPMVPSVPEACSRCPGRSTMPGPSPAASPMPPCSSAASPAAP
jgi:aspartyl-tRNA(Asn)/glutamyl-tRNA(Gln) amidotransferase subunit A